jgi:hypothetical protein
MSSFDTKDQTLTLAQGAALAAMTAPEEFGVEDLGGLIARASKKDVWIGFSTARGDPDSQGTLATLVSIRQGDGGSPARAKLKNDRSYVSYVPVPKSLTWDAVQKLAFDYDFVTGLGAPGHPWLKPLKFVDCNENSFYVKVSLIDPDGRDANDLIIRLGSPATDFSSGCTSSNWSRVNLISEDSKRVDARQLGTSELITVDRSKFLYGRRYVRAISIVVDKGRSTAAANYKARLLNAIVNDRVAKGELQVVAGGLN